MTLLIDTNIWIAAQDRTDPDHAACAALLNQHQGSLASPVTVITETAWFIEDRHGPHAEAAFLDLVTAGDLRAIEFTDADWTRCIELIRAYATLGLGLVDASIIAIAERLELTEIATMNRRDFYAVRPRHTEAFTLLPSNL